MRAHGLRGDLMVHAFHLASPLWEKGQVLALMPSQNGQEDIVQLEPLRYLTISALRQSPQGKLVLTFKELSDRTEAESLKGHSLAIDAQELEKSDDEYFQFELIGLKLLDSKTDKVLGEVLSTFNGAAQMLLEIHSEGLKDSWFVPFVAAFIDKVDLSEKCIRVSLPFGLDPRDDA